MEKHFKALHGYDSNVNFHLVNSIRPDITVRLECTRETENCFTVQSHYELVCDYVWSIINLCITYINRPVLYFVSMYILLGLMANIPSYWQKHVGLNFSLNENDFTFSIFDS